MRKCRPVVTLPVFDKVGAKEDKKDGDREYCQDIHPSKPSK